MIYVPYTKIQPATEIALIGYEYTPVKVSGKYGYSTYFKQLWSEGQTFINLEHDCVPWAGAIESLRECERDWCVFDYSLPVHRMRSLEAEVNGLPLGLMKIGASVIAQTPGCWDKLIDWSYCDQHLTKYLISKGLQVHQHYPSIVNANPVLLGLARQKG